MKYSIDKTKKTLDKASPTFCLCKWFDSDLNLYEGRSSSCHYCSVQDIDINKVLEDPINLLETPTRTVEKAKLSKGLISEECFYCNMLPKQVVTPRVTVSNQYLNFTERDSLEVLNNPELVAAPKHLRVAFSRQCNLSCIYCSSDVSSGWDQYPIPSNTPQRKRPPDEEVEVYISSFWKLWETTLKSSLIELRITGGEPLLHPEFWKILEDFKKNKYKITLAINTNLQRNVEKLIEKTEGLENFSIWTSCESSGGLAEYVRYGLDYKKFINNLNLCLDRFQNINMMMTLNAVTIFGLTSFLEDMLLLREKKYFRLNFNFLSQPEFLRLDVLPKDLKRRVHTDISNFLKNRESEFMAMEINDLRSILLVLERSSVSLLKRKDLKRHLLLFDSSRNISFRKVLPLDFIEWIDSFEI